MSPDNMVDVRFPSVRQYSDTLRIWELYPEFFRGRWLVLHQLARELSRPEIEPPPLKIPRSGVSRVRQES